LLGYIAFNNIKGVGNYTLQSSTSLGGSAVNESAGGIREQLKLVKPDGLSHMLLLLPAD